MSSSGGDHDEKVSMGVTAMLAVTVLLLTVGEIVPRTQSPTPLIRNKKTQLSLMKQLIWAKNGNFAP